jgi:uncharacterized membrane protein YcaP (DUF421 family)
VIETERLTDEEVVSAAREQGIEDLRHVRYGVLEPDGAFSFVRVDPSQRTVAPEKPS